MSRSERRAHTGCPEPGVVGGVPISAPDGRAMDCRKFRDQHTLFIDGKCSALEALEMRSHMRYCLGCDRRDTVVRRSILLVRNLPSIEPSAGFQARLDARLRQAAHAEFPGRRPSLRNPRAAGVAALAAALAFITLIASRVMHGGRHDAYRMPPVVASAPPREPSPFATSAFVATVPTGMSIWPAIMVASQAPAHFVAAERASER